MMRIAEEEAQTLRNLLRQAMEKPRAGGGPIGRAISCMRIGFRR